ncbi:hypothetical protein ACC712_37770, partial [Rhizobium ruizarguesonis]
HIYQAADVFLCRGTLDRGDECFPARSDLRIARKAREIDQAFGSDDLDGELAEKYGYVNRSLDDDKLDPFVDALATRISGFDRQEIADTKRLV